MSDDMMKKAMEIYENRKFKVIHFHSSKMFYAPFLEPDVRFMYESNHELFAEMVRQYRNDILALNSIITPREVAVIQAYRESRLNGVKMNEILGMSRHECRDEFRRVCRNLDSLVDRDMSTKVYDLVLRAHNIGMRDEVYRLCRYHDEKGYEHALHMVEVCERNLHEYE